MLSRLERRLGKYAIKNLTLFIVGGMAIVFVLSMSKPEFVSALTLDVSQLKKQPWRLVTYLFIPSGSSLFVIFELYWLWMIGRSLEEEWGAFKLNVFYFVGMIGTTIAALIVGGDVGNMFLNATLFLAFATVFPEYEIRIFFLIPIKMKWLGLLAGVGLVVAAVTGGWDMRAAIVAATANYVLFFAGHWARVYKSRSLQVRQTARRASLRPEAAPQTGGRVCAICGAREMLGADIRVCSCEKCTAISGGSRQLCLEHARNH